MWHLSWFVYYHHDASDWDEIQYRRFPRTWAFCGKKARRSNGWGIYPAHSIFNNGDASLFIRISTVQNFPDGEKFVDDNVDFLKSGSQHWAQRYHRLQRGLYISSNQLGPSLLGTKANFLFVSSSKKMRRYRTTFRTMWLFSQRTHAISVLYSLIRVPSLVYWYSTTTKRSTSAFLTSSLPSPIMQTIHVILSAP